jgi:hypothetical protein
MSSGGHLVKIILGGGGGGGVCEIFNMYAKGVLLF